MTENETNQRTITEQMNRKESETVGEARPGEERSEVNVANVREQLWPATDRGGQLVPQKRGSNRAAACMAYCSPYL